MQVQETASEPPTKLKDGPLKNNLKPRRTSHARSTSEASSMLSQEEGSESVQNSAPPTPLPTTGEGEAVTTVAIEKASEATE